MVPSDSAGRDKIPESSLSNDERYYGRVLGLHGPVTRSSIRDAYLRLSEALEPSPTQYLSIELREAKRRELDEAYGYFREKYGIIDIVLEDMEGLPLEPAMTAMEPPRASKIGIVRDDWIVDRPKLRTRTSEHDGQSLDLDGNAAHDEGIVTTAAVHATVPRTALASCILIARWIGVVPIALLGSALAFWLFQFLSWLSASYVDGVSNLEVVFGFIGSNCASGAGFVLCGVYTAPTHRRHVAYAATALLAFLTLGATWVFIHNEDYSSVFAQVLMLLGAVAAAYNVAGQDENNQEATAQFPRKKMGILDETGGTFFNPTRVLHEHKAGKMRNDMEGLPPEPATTEMESPRTSTIEIIRDDWDALRPKASAPAMQPGRHESETEISKSTESKMLTVEEFSSKMDSLNSVNAAYKLAIKRIAESGLAPFDFDRSTETLASIRNSATSIRDQLFVHYGQREGNDVIYIAISYADKLIECITFRHDMSAKLAHLAKGNSYGFFACRRDNKAFQRLEKDRQALEIMLQYEWLTLDSDW